MTKILACATCDYYRDMDEDGRAFHISRSKEAFCERCWDSMPIIPEPFASDIEKSLNDITSLIRRERPKRWYRLVEEPTLGLDQSDDA